MRVEEGGPGTEASCLECHEFESHLSKKHCHCVMKLSIVPLQEIVPFAVVGSNTLLEVNGKRVRGRLYPWGVVEGMLQMRR